MIDDPLAYLQSLPRFKVIVFAPRLDRGDTNIDYYYDFDQSIREYEKVFDELGIPWDWQPVTMDTYRPIIEEIAYHRDNNETMPVILNLCDGDEVNGTPGVSVIKLLDQFGLIYTGADVDFYEITTSKIPMKRAFEEAGVATAPWVAIHSTEIDAKAIFEKLGCPIIVKPAVSGGSMGVGVKNVVHDEASLQHLVNAMFEGYRGWSLTADGLIAESFVTGPEYTVLISGSHDRPEAAKVYIPVERVFHASIPEHEKFLSFDRLWEIYEEETPMPDNDNFYQYAEPDASRIEAICRLSWDAYVATQGYGYTRVDVRMDEKSGTYYVLEVNAQCGLSEDEDYTSIGAILRLSQCTFASLVAEILYDAFQRHRSIAAAPRN
jgi:D-alanine-D-alanine ligase